MQTKQARTSTVGRSKKYSLNLLGQLPCFTTETITLSNKDALNCYDEWEPPTAIISDGAYGVLGFEGDTSSHSGIGKWYEPHIIEWTKKSTPQTTLWFWNSEIGWAATHPILEAHGWRYVNANIWNKGLAYITGNVNTAKIRRFPVVTEICVRYILEPKVNNLSLQKWLYAEWKRSKLPFKKANEACGAKDAAARKYLDQGHLWYFPPPEMFARLCEYANTFGDPKGKPQYSTDGRNPLTAVLGPPFIKRRCADPQLPAQLWNR